MTVDTEIPAKRAGRSGWSIWRNHPLTEVTHSYYMSAEAKSKIHLALFLDGAMTAETACGLTLDCSRPAAVPPTKCGRCFRTR